MTNATEHFPLTLKRRLQCLLAVTEKEADALLVGDRTLVDTTAVGQRVGLKQSNVEQIISSRTAVETARIDVNKVTQLQLEHVPGVIAQKIRSVLEGRPYFSIHEFEEASGLAAPIVTQLFTVPCLELIDKVTGKRRRFDAIYGEYIARPSLEFESSKLVEDFGFYVRPADSNTPLRVIATSDNESTIRAHELKRALGGQLSPVVYDDEGFERYFLPAAIDVWFRQDICQKHVLAAINQLGLRIKVSRAKIGYYQTELGTYPTDLHVLAATLDKIQELNDCTEVEFAEPSEVGFEDFEPENERLVPDFESAQAGSRVWNTEAIELEAAHAVTEGSTNVTIMVVDSGIRAAHQDLSPALMPDWSLLDLNFDLGVPEAELSPLELSIAHGTKVASVAAGRGPGGDSRVRGLAPGCWLLPVKISGSPYGQSYGLRAAAIREALDYIPPGKRCVINISWSTNGEHQGIREALFAASERGFAITTSAGNYRFGENQTPDKLHYPSQYAFLPNSTYADVQARRKIPGLASVTAVDSFKKKASYSYFGNQSVTVSAPGGEPGFSGAGVFVASTPNDYSYDAGTSFAAPHVAGLIALIWSVKPDLTAQAVVDVVRTTATDLDANNPGFKSMLGAGLINARAALESLGLSGSPPSTRTTTLGESGTLTEYSKRVNINSASQEELETLPYIGEWLAVIVVDYRSTRGPFESIWDLTHTGSVDRWTVEQIANLITTESASSLETRPNDVTSTSESSSIDIVNINTASVQELMALPFIGDWSARAIIIFRNAHGFYKTIWELASTGAFDRWTIEQISHLITAGKI